MLNKIKIFLCKISILIKHKMWLNNEQFVCYTIFFGDMIE